MRIEEDYIQALKVMRPNIYLEGRKISHGDSLIMPAVNGRKGVYIFMKRSIALLFKESISAPADC